MEAVLPQRRQVQRKHHHNHTRSRDPPTGNNSTIPQAYNRAQRRKKKGSGRGDGYENSGHETSDFPFTEDDKSDFYLVTEDDRDNDDNGKVSKDGDDDDDLVEFYAAAKNLSLGSDEDSTTGVDEGDNKSPSKNPKEEQSSNPLSDEKPAPQSQVDSQSQNQATTSPIKAKKKRQRNKRTPKSKKASQQTAVQEDHPQPMISTMQQEEELDCHTPMKTTLRQQQLHQTPEKAQAGQHQSKSGQKQQQPQQQRGAIHEKEEEQLHDPHEDEDDYPSNMMATPVTKEDQPKQKTLEEELTFLHKHKPQQPKRTLEEELSFLKRISPTRYQVQLGFVPNMKVPAEIIVNNDLQTLLVQELRDSCCGPKSSGGGGPGGFIPSLRQAANVAALPGIVRASLAMPDVHSGYGFCIGNVAAFDMDDPLAVISPGGVGFDINCGVRLIRTNLTEDDVREVSVREKLAEAMFRNIPVGVGAGGDIPCNMQELDKLLSTGIDWAIEKGYAWKEDKDHCEENGCMETADPKFVSHRAKKRGLKQIGTLGAGNHYAEIQIVDEIYHPEAAETMGIGKLGQVCIMIHTGSR